MLRGLGRDEVDSLIAERGLAEVGCDFCGAQYRFDAVDVGEVFVPAREQPPGSSRGQLNFSSRPSRWRSQSGSPHSAHRCRQRGAVSLRAFSPARTARNALASRCSP